MAIFNNIFLDIFLLFFIVYLVLKLWFDFKEVKPDDTLPDFLNKIHNYRITNIYYIFFIIFFYFTITIMLFIIIRYNLLGFKHNIFIFNISTFFMQYIFIILCIIYYLKIIFLDFYLNIIKLHFYLVYHSEQYNRFCLTLSGHYSLLEQICQKITPYFYYTTCDMSEFKEAYKRFIKLNKETTAMSYVLKRKKIWRFYLIINIFLSKYIYLRYLIKSVFHIIDFIDKNCYRFLYYIPYTILIFTFLYEINVGYFYYIYYILLYIFINTYVKKIRFFYKVKDPYFDYLLATYFYKDDTVYHEHKTIWLEKKPIDIIMISLMPEQVKNIITIKDDLINYILNSYKVYFALDKNWITNEKFLNARYIRLHILILLFSLNIYYCFLKTIILIIFNVYFIKVYYISIPLLCTLYVIHNNILYFNEFTDNWVENLKYKKYFYVVLCISALPLVLCYLKNKITIMPSEIILNLEYIFRLQEHFSLQEKYDYTDKYITYLQLKEIYDNDVLATISEKIKTNSLITEKTNLNEIRNLIQTLCEEPNKKLISVLKKNL